MQSFTRNHTPCTDTDIQRNLGEGYRNTMLQSHYYTTTDFTTQRWSLDKEFRFHIRQLSTKNMI